MRITHIAVWSEDIEALRRFYVTHFGCQPNALYQNPRIGFSSYFLEFEDGPRLELMQITGLARARDERHVGLVHFAISTGSEENVQALTAKLAAAGVRIVDEPRWSGDGYFESVVADPDNNLIEITI